MMYKSTRLSDERVTFREAVLNGLAANGGLYYPVEVPRLPTSFFDNIEDMDEVDIAYTALAPYVGEDLDEAALRSVIAGTLVFPMPVVEVKERVYCLEMFHGPTKAFKDVGARFLSRCMSHFLNEGERTTVLVATSGDTGSAVANGFYKVDNIEVKILFPKGKVSPYQQYQMTSLGENIEAHEVNGTFDDCQALVKQAFDDEQLRKEISLSSANSINIARLLPQMLYYIFAYKQIKQRLGGRQLYVSVPSGNLGNLTAALFAKRMGLPVDVFVAAHNSNDTFTRYIDGHEYAAKPSVQTYSNAMDVGDPSNYTRIAMMYEGSRAAMKADVISSSWTDDATLAEIKSCSDRYDYLLDPHGAVGKLGLEAAMADDSVGIFVGTAHPKKFESVIRMVFPDYPIEDVDLSTCVKHALENDYSAFKTILLRNH